jgi:hypothetical protein
MVDRITIRVITEKDVLFQEETEQSGREIVGGEWAENNEMAGQAHGLIGTNLILLLAPFVKMNQLGQVYPDNVNYVLEAI